MKANFGDTPEIQKWLADNLDGNSHIGIDPTLISESSWKKWNAELEKKQSKMVSVHTNLVDLIWQPEKTIEGSQKPVFVYPVEYAGEKWQDKVARVKAAMEKENCSVLVVSALDEIAWLFNLRFIYSFTSHFLKILFI